MKQEKALDKVLSKMILKSRHLYYEVCKLSKNFTEGNARKVSVVFLHWLLCDVVKSQNDHARMRQWSSGVIATFESEKNRLSCSSAKLLLAILRPIFGHEHLE